MTGFEGDSIVSAVSANGKRSVSKAGGFFSDDVWDPRCLVRVDGELNVRAGHRRVVEGMVVDSLPRAQPGGRLPQTLVRLQDRIGRGVAADSIHPVRVGRQTVHVDVLIRGGGPAGLAAAVAAVREGARVQVVDHRHYLGGHLRWGDDSDRALAQELEAAVRAQPDIAVLLGASVVGPLEDGWALVSQQQVEGFDDYLWACRALSYVESADLRIASPRFEGGDEAGVMSAEAVRRLINLYAVLPGDRAVLVGGTSEADAARADMERVGIDVVQALDPREDPRSIESVSKSRKSLQVKLSDGSSVDADLVVVGKEWTHWAEPESNSALLTGRAVVGVPRRGDRQHESLVAHGVATGRLAARRAIAQRQRENRLTPGSQTSAEQGVTWPTDTRPFRKAVDLGPTESGLGVAPTLGALAGAGSQGSCGRPRHESAVQPWLENNGAVQTVVAGRVRTEHFGDPLDEVRKARSGVGVHTVESNAILLLSGRSAGALLGSLAKDWADLKLGQLRVGEIRALGSSALRGFAGALTNESFVLTVPTEFESLAVQVGRRWIARHDPAGDTSIHPMTAGYTGIRVSGPNALDLVSRLSDGIVTDFPPGRLERLWLAGAADCLVMRPAIGIDPFLELYVPAGFGRHVWEMMFELSTGECITPVGSRADRILQLETGQLWVPVGSDSPWSGSTVVELETEDPSLVPQESCRIVSGEGVQTLGRVLVAEFCPSIKRSLCLAEIAPQPAGAVESLMVVNPDGERISVRARTKPLQPVVADV